MGKKHQEPTGHSVPEEHAFGVTWASKAASPGGMGMVVPQRARGTANAAANTKPRTAPTLMSTVYRSDSARASDDAGSVKRSIRTRGVTYARATGERFRVVHGRKLRCAGERRDGTRHFFDGRGNGSPSISSSSSYVSFVESASPRFALSAETRASRASSGCCPKRVALSALVRVVGFFFTWEKYHFARALHITATSTSSSSTCTWRQGLSSFITSPPKSSQYRLVASTTSAIGRSSPVASTSRAPPSLGAALTRPLPRESPCSVK